MALDATKWSVDRATGDIRYDYGTPANLHDDTPNYSTVIQVHRWLQDLADDALASGDDELDITDQDPSARSTDNIITLLGDYNIDDQSAEYIYDGSINQGETGIDKVVYDGIVNYGNADVQIQLIQDGEVIADPYWNQGGIGINADNAAGISHRFLIKVHDYVNDGGDIDGKRLVGTTRTYGNTYGEFKINGTANGNNVLALVDSTDGNNATAEGTIGALTDVYLDRSTNSTTVDGVNSTGQAVLNVVDGGQFTAGDFLMIAGDDAEYQVLSISTNALTLNHNLDVATTGSEVLYDLNIGFSEVDVNNNGTAEDYYAQWDKGANTINTFYERMKWLSRDTSTEYVYGIPAELFRGITHEITIEAPTGTFAAVEAVTWTGGTGQMLAIDSTTAGTLMWIQLLTGVAPVDEETITGDISGATCSCETGVTEVVDRVSTLKFPFIGSSTGTALDGAYGITLQTTDLAATDKVRDLTNTQITPPNNVTYTISGLESGEDRVLVAPWDGSSYDNEGNPAVDEDQLSLDTALSSATETAVVCVEDIPSDTPATGTIRVKDDDGFFRRLTYTSWTSKTFTIDSAAFNGGADSGTNQATSANDIYISYIDTAASASTAAFTAVYDTDRTLVILVRDGGASPIKQYITSGTFVSSDSGTGAIRTTDE